MNSGIHTVIYPVEDLGRAKALYQSLLGTDPYVDEPYYVGFRLGDQTPTATARERQALSPTTTSTTSRTSCAGSATAAPLSRARSATSAGASWWSR